MFQRVRIRKSSIDLIKNFVKIEMDRVDTEIESEINGQRLLEQIETMFVLRYLTCICILVRRITRIKKLE